MGRVLAGISNKIAITKKNQVRFTLCKVRTLTLAPQRTQGTVPPGEHGCNTWHALHSARPCAAAVATTGETVFV
jgi:hypothetical protein